MKPETGIKVSGRVIHGDHYGKVLGFPTANLEINSCQKHEFKIKFGVWAGWAEFKLKAVSCKLKAGIVIGPMDKQGLPKIEAHLIGFHGNLYGRRLNLYLNKYIRPFRKFSSEAELKRQIGKDIKIISKMKYGRDPE